jgi:hypothetical protein
MHMHAVLKILFSLKAQDARLLIESDKRKEVSCGVLPCNGADVFFASPEFRET